MRTQSVMNIINFPCWISEGQITECPLLCCNIMPLKGLATSVKGLNTLYRRPVSKSHVFLFFIDLVVRWQALKTWVPRAGEGTCRLGLTLRRCSAQSCREMSLVCMGCRAFFVEIMSQMLAERRHSYVTCQVRGQVRGTGH